MIKHEEINNPDSCLNRALPQERVFVLLARDQAAPWAIRAWAEWRIHFGAKRDDPQIVEALECAKLMEKERDAINKARKP